MPWSGYISIADCRSRVSILLLGCMYGGSTIYPLSRWLSHTRAWNLASSGQLNEYEMNRKRTGSARTCFALINAAVTWYVVDELLILPVPSYIITTVLCYTIV